MSKKTVRIIAGILLAVFSSLLYATMFMFGPVESMFPPSPLYMVAAFCLFLGVYIVNFVLGYTGAFSKQLLYISLIAGIIFALFFIIMQSGTVHIQIANIKQIIGITVVSSIIAAVIIGISWLIPTKR